MAGGRPSLYTPELAGLICERIALGEAVEQIGEAPDMPTGRTIWRWLDAHEEFRQRYARAKERATDLMAEQMLAIADAKDAAENPNWAKLRVDTRKWLMSKLAAKKYGDNQNLNVTGNITVQRLAFDELRLIGEGTGDE